MLSRRSLLGQLMTAPVAVVAALPLLQVATSLAPEVEPEAQAADSAAIQGFTVAEATSLPPLPPMHMALDTDIETGVVRQYDAFADEWRAVGTHPNIIDGAIMEFPKIGWRMWRLGAWR